MSVTNLGEEIEETYPGEEEASGLQNELETDEEPKERLRRARREESD